MGIDLHALRMAIGDHGPVVRVVVAEVAGSAPREAGTAMIVWPSGQSGTIGGGALEYRAAATARQMLARGEALRLDRQALGPHLGQCCGGSVTLLSELWDAAALERIEGEVVARRVTGNESPPLAVRRALTAKEPPLPRLVQGWMIEPVSRPTRQMWVWGAGHVGRALIDILRPLPQFALTWADTSADRFPEVPAGVTPRIAADIAALLPEAPRDAEHLIVTYSHDIDLELCHRLLRHGFARCGLIGSATKWARFRSRLAALGHEEAQILRIACPIGDPSLGKHPQAIAVGVAAALLRPDTTDTKGRA